MHFHICADEINALISVYPIVCNWVNRVLNVIMRRFIKKFQ